MKTIPLGTKVVDKVTGFTGIAENRTTFLYGVDMYCVQPQVDKDGAIPKAAMIDATQLEIEGSLPVMEAQDAVELTLSLGQKVKDIVSGRKGTLTGRAVYLNGCTRVLIEPKYSFFTLFNDKFWVEEHQVVAVKPLFARKAKTEKAKSSGEVYTEDNGSGTVTMGYRTTGGPARSSSKY